MLIKKFFRFSCVSAIGTLTQFITLTLLVELFAISVVIASDIGMILGALVNYFLGRRFAFNSKIPHQRAMIKFFLIAAMGLIFNSVIMHAATAYMPYLLAQVFATGIVVFWNFSANHYWTFNPKHEPL